MEIFLTIQVTWGQFNSFCNQLILAQKCEELGGKHSNSFSVMPTNFVALASENSINNRTVITFMIILYSGRYPKG